MQKFRTLKGVFTNLMIIILLSFSSCDEPELEINNFDNQVSKDLKIETKRVSFADILVNPKLNTILKLSDFSKKKTDVLNIKWSTDGEKGIHLDKVNYTSKGDYHSYTFPIVHKNFTPFIENLLISLQPNGSYKGFLLRYHLDERDINNVSEGIRIEGLNSKVKVKIINLDDYAFLEETFSKTDGWCKEEIVSQATGWTIYIDVLCGDSIGGGDGNGGDTIGGGGDDHTGDPNYSGNNNGTGGNGGSGSGGSNNPNSDAPCLDCLGDFSTFIFEGNYARLVSILGYSLYSPEADWLKNVHNYSVSSRLANILHNYSNSASAKLFAQRVLSLAMNRNISSARLYADRLISFVLNNINNTTTIAEALLRVNIELATKNNDGWVARNGNYRNRSSIKYTHVKTDLLGNTYYRLENGDYTINSQVQSLLNVQDRNISQIPSSEDGGTYDYYWSEDTQQHYEMKLPPEDKPLDASLDFLINAFWDGAQFTGRYIIPVEDVIILIDGKDFDGQEANQALAGGMLLVGFIPGGKILKPLARVVEGTHAIKLIIQVGDKTIVRTVQVLRREVLDKFTDAVLSGIKQRIDDAVKNGEFLDDVVEEVAEQIQDIVEREGRRLDWERIKALFQRGNNFNKKGYAKYDYNEIVLGNGKRLDSYVPGEKIISRKATDIDNIKESTWRSYCQEILNKYRRGTPVNSTSLPGEPPLSGNYFLEIPLSNQNASNLSRFREIAREYGIDILFLAE